MEYTGEKLQAMADDLRERMRALQRFDAVGEINAYCDELEADVTVTFESAFRHLQRLQESMLGEISEYRRALIEAQQQRAASSDPTHRFKLTEELVQLAVSKEAIPQLSEQSRSRAAESLKNHLRVVKEREGALRKQTMGGRFMRFKPNRFFDIVLDHVGSFEYLDELPPAYRRVEIDTDCYCVAKDCENILQISFMPGDRLVVCTLSDGVFIYRASNLSLLERIPDLAMSFSVLPDERLVIGKNDGELWIYDYSKPLSTERKRNVVILASNKNGNRREIISQALLPNGNLASADARCRIEIWKLSLAGTDRALLLSLDENLPSRLGALPNGFLVSYTMQMETVSILKLWDLKSTQPLRVAVTPLIFAISMLVVSNDQVALGDGSGNIAIYDVIHMQPVWNFKLETVSGIGALGLLPNGSLIAGDKHSRFNIWDLNSGKLVQTPDTGLQNEFASISISPDGKRIAIAAIDHELKISKLEIACSARED